jgi:hypothetical protein
MDMPMAIAMDSPIHMDIHFHILMDIATRDVIKALQTLGSARAERPSRFPIVFVYTFLHAFQSGALLRYDVEWRFGLY